MSLPRWKWQALKCQAVSKVEIGLENEKVIADLTAEIYELAGET